MVKSFKESHAKDLEKLAADRQRQAEKKVTEDLVNAPKHTVLSMAGLTSAVWTLGMFQMVSGESCQCIQRTKQTEPCHVGVRHAACTVPKCGFVIRYQNTSNLEQHYNRVDLITKNSPVDWQQRSNWTGGCSWELQQMAAWPWVAHATP